MLILKAQQKKKGNNSSEINVSDEDETNETNKNKDAKSG
jgi:hypothetical protein